MTAGPGAWPGVTQGGLPDECKREYRARGVPVTAAVLTARDGAHPRSPRGAPARAGPRRIPGAPARSDRAAGVRIPGPAAAAHHEGIARIRRADAADPEGMGVAA